MPITVTGDSMLIKTDESNYTSYGKLIHRSVIIITSYAVPVAVAVLTTVS